MRFGEGLFGPDSYRSDTVSAGLWPNSLGPTVTQGNSFSGNPFYGQLRTSHLSSSRPDYRARRSKRSLQLFAKMLPLIHSLKPIRRENGASAAAQTLPREALNRSTSPANRLLAHIFSQVHRKVPQLDIAQVPKLVHRRLVGSSPLAGCSPTHPAPVSTSLLKQRRTSGRRFARSGLAGAFAEAFGKVTPFAGATRARRVSQSLLLWRSPPTWRRWTLFVAET